MAKKISRYLPGLSLGETAPASKGSKQPKRNGHAFHPIMNKGGAHEKSKGAQRAAAKRQTNQKVREWLGRSSSTCMSKAGQAAHPPVVIWAKIEH